jgi:hypothetical protein
LFRCIWGVTSGLQTCKTGVLLLQQPPKWFHFFLSHCLTFITMLNGETHFLDIENETQFSNVLISKELFMRVGVWIQGLVYAREAFFHLRKGPSHLCFSDFCHRMSEFFSWRHPWITVPLTHLPPYIWDNS